MLVVRAVASAAVVRAFALAVGLFLELRHASIAPWRSSWLYRPAAELAACKTLES